jgi:hypothetical protein
MFTSAECREYAKEKIAQAEREPRHRERLLTAAQAWLILAGQMRQLETSLDTAGTFRGDLLRAAD